MAARSLVPRLMDIIEAIDVIRTHTVDVALEAFEADRDRRWLVERAVEIISQASRHLTDEMKTRHPQIPWQRVAGIGNVLRHEYARVAPDVIWAIAHEHLPELDRVCRKELLRAQACDDGG